LEQEGSLPKAKIPEACFMARGAGGIFAEGKNPKLLNLYHSIN
jgi:hypothetical protein